MIVIDPGHGGQDSGAIGGSGSKELMVLAESGEDTIAVCSKCEYG